MRRSRERLPTPHFALEPDEYASVANGPKKLRFSDPVDPTDEPKAGTRSARGRIPTPFVCMDAVDINLDSDNVAPQLETSEHETVEDVSGVLCRRARGRIATPFVSSGSCEDAQPHVQISTDPPTVEDVEVQSNVRMRTSRERIPTPFASSLQSVDFGIHFAESNIATETAASS